MQFSGCTWWASSIFFLLFLQYLIVPCGKFKVPYLGTAQQPQEQRYPLLSVCAVFFLSKQRYGCQGLGFLRRTQMLMHATAHGGCVDAVRETALEPDTAIHSFHKTLWLTMLYHQTKSDCKRTCRWVDMVKKKNLKKRERKKEEDILIMLVSLLLWPWKYCTLFAQGFGSWWRHRTKFCHKRFNGPEAHLDKH